MSEITEADREAAKRLLILLCSDDKGISIPLRRQPIEAAEQAIAEALASARDRIP